MHLKNQTTRSNIEFDLINNNFTLILKTANSTILERQINLENENVYSMIKNLNITEERIFFSKKVNIQYISTMYGMDFSRIFSSIQNNRLQSKYGFES